MNWASSEAIVSAFWAAFFQLVAIAIAGFVANVIYRRFRDRFTARRELLNDIDDFSIQLYRPRKTYQIMIDNPDRLLSQIATPQERETERLRLIHQAMCELVEATGRFRTLQVALISLYGFNLNLLSHYLAIWFYLKDLRHRMERGASLYFQGDNPEGEDDFYRLFDSFRYRVSVARYAPPVAVIQPPKDVLATMHEAGRQVFEEYFGVPAAEATQEKTEQHSGL